MKKLILIISALGLAAGVYVWFYVYNKPHTDYENKPPDYIMTAKELYDRFVENPNLNYTGKVIQINGVFQSVEDDDSLITVVFVFNEGMFGSEGVRCTFIPRFNEQLRKLKAPGPISLKGFCSGYNGTDVILEHCSPAN